MNKRYISYAIKRIFCNILLTGERLWERPNGPKSESRDCFECRNTALIVRKCWAVPKKNFIANGLLDTAVVDLPSAFVAKPRPRIEEKWVLVSACESYISKERRHLDT